MRNKLEKLLLISLFIIPIFGKAAVITYSNTRVAASTWSTNFLITAGANETVEEFTIFFESNLYANLSVQNAPAGWSVIAISPDTSIPADGFLDALALSTALPNGTSLGDFVVQYEFLGAGVPGSQRFDIVDPLSFVTLSSGRTIQSIGGPSPGEVPVPGTLPLLALGSVMLMKFRRRQVTDIDETFSIQGGEHGAH